MSTYVSNTTPDAVADAMRHADRILITSHQKPDGDAMGSVLAVHRALTAIGKTSQIYLGGPIEPCLLTVAGPTPINRLEDGMPGDDFDLAIVVDTGAWSQLAPIEPWLRSRREMTIGIDHHVHGDDVAARRIVEPMAAATTQVLLSIIDALGVDLDGGEHGIAEALFVGLATDTGWFRYGNAEEDVFATAARLLALGVEKSRLYQIIEESHRPARLTLEGRALTSLAYAAEGSVSIMSLTAQDFIDAEGTTEDLTGLVNLPMVVGSIRVSILLVESEPELTKISFRSKRAAPGADADDFVDVNLLARTFGGGGHKHAAGARIAAPLSDALAQIRAAVDG